MATINDVILWEMETQIQVFTFYWLCDSVLMLWFELNVNSSMLTCWCLAGLILTVFIGLQQLITCKPLLSSL